jgi:hypothetical protein
MEALMTMLSADRFNAKFPFRMLSPAIGAMALGLASFAPVAPASAEVLSISATALVKHCNPCIGDAEDRSEEDRGVLHADGPGRYFAAVVFPVTAGQRVCSFSMVYRDVNGEESVKAMLVRKSYTVNGSPTGGRTVMATATSAGGTPDTVRVATDTSITGAALTSVRTFYYIEAVFSNVNQALLGFEIVYKPTCP